MDMIIGVINRILALVREVLSYFGLSTENVPEDVVIPEESETV